MMFDKEEVKPDGENAPLLQPPLILAPHVKKLVEEDEQTDQKPIAGIILALVTSKIGFRIAPDAAKNFKSTLENFDIDKMYPAASFFVKGVLNFLHGINNLWISFRNWLKPNGKWQNREAQLSKEHGAELLKKLERGVTEENAVAFLKELDEEISKLKNRLLPGAEEVGAFKKANMENMLANLIIAKKSLVEQIQKGAVESTKRQINQFHNQIANCLSKLVKKSESTDKQGMIEQALEERGLSKILVLDQNPAETGQKDTQIIVEINMLLPKLSALQQPLREVEKQIDVVHIVAEIIDKYEIYDRTRYPEAHDILAFAQSSSANFSIDADFVQRIMMLTIPELRVARLIDIANLQDQRPPSMTDDDEYKRYIIRHVEQAERSLQNMVGNRKSPFYLYQATVSGQECSVQDKIGILKYARSCIGNQTLAAPSDEQCQLFGNLKRSLAVKPTIKLVNRPDRDVTDFGEISARDKIGMKLIELFNRAKAASTQETKESYSLNRQLSGTPATLFDHTAAHASAIVGKIFVRSSDPTDTRMLKILLSSNQSELISLLLNRANYQLLQNELPNALGCLNEESATLLYQTVLKHDSEGLDVKANRLQLISNILNYCVFARKILNGSQPSIQDHAQILLEAIQIEAAKIDPRDELSVNVYKSFLAPLRNNLLEVRAPGDIPFQSNDPVYLLLRLDNDRASIEKLVSQLIKEAQFGKVKQPHYNYWKELSGKITNAIEMLRKGDPRLIDVLPSDDRELPQEKIARLQNIQKLISGLGNIPMPTKVENAEEMLIYNLSKWSGILPKTPGMAQDLQAAIGNVLQSIHLPTAPRPTP